MSYGDSHRTAPDRAPLVGRPRGAAWRTLQADGVVWEGQVHLVGGDTDLAARMIVTHRRVAFARGGAIALDLARDWLRPAPILRRDGTILLSITPPGSGYGIEPETISLRMRDGHPAAGHVIGMLAGSGARRITPDAVPSSEYVRGLLPPLPDVRRSASLRGPDDNSDLPEVPILPRPVDDDLGFASFDEVPKPKPHLPPLPDSSSLSAFDRETVVRLAAPPTSLTRDRTWNLEPMREIAPRGVRHRRRGWVFRLGGLVVLVGVASLFATGRVPVRQAPQPGMTEVAATATVRPVAQYVALTAAAGLPLTVAADSTAAAIGVGGETAQSSSIPTPAAVAQEEQPAPRPTDDPAPTTAPTSETAPTQPAVSEATSQTSTATETEAPEPTAAPATEAAGETEPVAATVASTAVAGPLQVTIDLATRGATLPEFGLAGTGNGDWVTILLSIANEGDSAASLSLTDFSLTGAGEAVFAVDERSTVVASILRLDGAPDNLDSAISLDPGESAELALVFQVPGDTTDLSLMRGATPLELGPDVPLASRLTMTRGFAAQTPKAIEDTVLGHILGDED